MCRGKGFVWPSLPAQCRSRHSPQELPRILSPSSRPPSAPKVQLSLASHHPPAPHQQQLGQRQLSRGGGRDTVISVTQGSLPLAEQLSDGFCITDFLPHPSGHLKRSSLVGWGPLPLIFLEKPTISNTTKTLQQKCVMLETGSGQGTK